MAFSQTMKCYVRSHLNAYLFCGGTKYFISNKLKEKKSNKNGKFCQTCEKSILMFCNRKLSELGFNTIPFMYSVGVKLVCGFRTSILEEYKVWECRMKRKRKGFDINYHGCIITWKWISICVSPFYKNKFHRWRRQKLPTRFMFLFCSNDLAVLLLVVCT